MENISDRIVRGLKQYVKRTKRAGGIRQLGKDLGFDPNRVHNVFYGGRPLNAEELFRIISIEDYSLPELRKYMPRLVLRSDSGNTFKTNDDFFESVNVFVKAENEARSLDAYLISTATRIQGSPYVTNEGKPLSEVARDVMRWQDWYFTNNGWILSAEHDDEGTFFKPVAPDFKTAVDMMERMGWVERKDDTANAYWSRINDEKAGSEAKKYCREAMIQFLLSHEDLYDLDDDFRYAISDELLISQEDKTVAQYVRLLEEVELAVGNLTRYQLSAEKNEYGISDRDVYGTNKYAKVRMLVLDADATRSELRERGVNLSRELEDRFDELGKNVLVQNVLATSDRRDQLAEPTLEELATSIKLENSWGR